MCPGAEVLDMSVAIELQPHAGGPGSVRLLRPHEEGQVEPRVPRAAVEVQPLGPRVLPRRRIGNRMEPVDLTQHRLGRALRPRDVLAGVAPLAARRDLGIAHRALEARDAAARVDADRRRAIVVEQEQRRRVPRRRGSNAAAQLVRLQRAGQHHPRGHRRFEMDQHVAAADQRAGDRAWFEHDLGDAQQDRHHRHADAEAGREHGRPHRMRRERPDRKPPDHACRSRSRCARRASSARAWSARPAPDRG